MSWNIRGLGQDPKVIAIRNAISKHKTTICSIQESKRELVDDALIRIYGAVIDATKSMYHQLMYPEE